METSKMRIIFPTDFSEYSENVWKGVVDFAKAYDAELFVVHVVEPPSGVIKFLAEFNDELAIKQAHKLMDNFINTHTSDGVHITKMVKIGRSVKEIGKAVLETDASLIIMGTHGDSGVHEFFIGSHASQVVRLAPCPVLTLRDSFKGDSFKKILIPIDLTKEASEIVAAGMNMANLFNASVHLLSMAEKSFTESEKQDVMKKLESAESVAKSRGIDFSSDMVEVGPNSVDFLIDYADENGVDLICIMTQQELNVKELFMGSSAAHVVNKSQIPVLSVRPQNMFANKGQRSYFN